jgi:hypothetical protein
MLHLPESEKIAEQSGEIDPTQFQALAQKPARQRKLTWI